MGGAREVTGVVKHPLSLNLPEGLSFDEWLTVGQGFADAERSLRWWVGDWWAYGKHNYGDRLKAIQEGKGLRLSFNSCAAAGRVSRQFETCRRRQVLKWSHHQEVAMFNPADQDKWLDRVEKEGLSQKQLRELIKAERMAPPIVTVEKRRGVRMAVPEGKTAEELCREGMRSAANGASAKEVGKLIGVGSSAFRQMRDIVLLADRTDLAPRHRVVADNALADLNLNCQPGASHNMVAKLIDRVWGENRKGKGGRESIERRLNENLKRLLGMLEQICETTESIELPYLGDKGSIEALERLKQCEQRLKAFRSRIEGTLL